MDLTNETKVKDIALADPSLRRVLEDAGVDYCCGGEKSLHHACLHANISAEDVLTRLRANRKIIEPANEHWAAAPLSELTEHIRTKHHRYVREAVSQGRALSAKVKARHSANHPELAEIEKLFVEIGDEMLMHMQKEEMVLFPYMEALERAAQGKGSLEAPFFGTVRNPIQMMMQEHESAGERVKQIRSLSEGYTAPPDACTSYRALYKELQEFEADLHEHVHLENNILFPRAVELEGVVP
jgi:regulator of cell morphogenesis and NO signaling